MFGADSVTRGEALDRARTMVRYVMCTTRPEPGFDRRSAERALAESIYELHQARPDLAEKRRACQVNRNPKRA